MVWLGTGLHMTAERLYLPWYNTRAIYVKQRAGQGECILGPACFDASCSFINMNSKTIVKLSSQFDIKNCFNLHHVRTHFVLKKQS